MNTNHVLASQIRNKSNVVRSTTSPALSMSMSLTFDASKPKEDGPVYFRTENADGYDISGLTGYYLLGYIGTRPSNLNITTITLVGPSGVAHSHDEIDTNIAARLWDKLKSGNFVDYTDLGTTYVGD